MRRKDLIMAIMMLSLSTLIDSGKKYDVRYYKYKITDPFMSASYNLYFDGEAAYVLSFLNMDENVAARTIMRITDIMGLP